MQKKTTLKVFWQKTQIFKYMINVKNIYQVIYVFQNLAQDVKEDMKNLTRTGKQQNSTRKTYREKKGKAKLVIPRSPPYLNYKPSLTLGFSLARTLSLSPSPLLPNRFFSLRDLNKKSSNLFSCSRSLGGAKIDLGFWVSRPPQAKNSIPFQYCLLFQSTCRKTRRL